MIYRTNLHLVKYDPHPMLYNLFVYDKQVRFVSIVCTILIQHGSHILVLMLVYMTLLNYLMLAFNNYCFFVIR